MQLRRGRLLEVGQAEESLNAPLSVNAPEAMTRGRDATVRDVGTPQESLVMQRDRPADREHSGRRHAWRRRGDDHRCASERTNPEEP